jgi:hypothetical protein
MNLEKRNVVVELFATQTEISVRRFVVEIPTDCSEGEIKSLGSEALDRLVTENGSEAAWEFQEYESDFEIQTDVRVGQATDLSADIELTFDDEEYLVAVDE